MKKTKSKSFSPNDAINFAYSLLTLDNTISAEAAIRTITLKLTAELPPDTFPPEAITAMATEVYNQALAKHTASAVAAEELSRISPAEMDAVHSLIAANATAITTMIQGNNSDGVVLTPGTDRLVDLIVALTTYSLSSYHPSNWIRYDKKEIFALARLQKLPASEQEELTQQVHNTFGLNMRVIGSNQPIPCYLIPWLVPPQPEISLIVHKLDPFKVYTSLMTEINNHI